MPHPKSLRTLLAFATCLTATFAARSSNAQPPPPAAPASAAPEAAAPASPPAPALPPAPATASPPPPAAESPPAPPEPPSESGWLSPPKDPDPQNEPETLSPVPPDPASPAAAASAADVEEATTPGWFRVDSDLAGVSLWVGATHDLGGVGLATDVMLSSGTFSDLAAGTVVPFSIAEFDIGPAFAFVDGAVALTPMVGIQFDWVQRRTVSLPAPQLFTIVNLGPVYFESWVQFYFYGLFTDGASVRDNFYTRNFLLYKLADSVAFGPHVELTYLFHNRRVFSLPVGGALMLNYGKESTLLLALGYETDADARASSGGSGDRAIAGRFTFIRTW